MLRAALILLFVQIRYNGVMSHRIEFVCDHCGETFTTDESMDQPPYWFGIQVVIADQSGIIPVQEREIYNHFCSQECLIYFCQGEELRMRKCTVDKKFDDEDEEDSGDG